MVSATNTQNRRYSTYVPYLFSLFHGGGGCRKVVECCKVLFFLLLLPTRMYLRHGVGVDF